MLVEHVDGCVQAALETAAEMNESSLVLCNSCVTVQWRAEDKPRDKTLNIEQVNSDTSTALLDHTSDTLALEF